MFKRKLTALQFHSPDNFNITDRKEFRSLIVWLEDQKIRCYKIEDRAAIKNIAANDWEKNFKKYLSDLNYSGDTNDLYAVVDWLLGIAIRAEYGDNVEKYQEQTAESVAKTSTNIIPQVVSSNPLDNLNFDDPEFKNGVNALAKLLNVTQHPDHLITLQAISRLVKQKLSPDAIKTATIPTTEPKPQLIQEIDLGFDAGDYVLNQAAKILRWLYVVELRDLQTRVNEAIVVVQSITANPQTDSRLGKVGK